MCTASHAHLMTSTTVDPSLACINKACEGMPATNLKVSVNCLPNSWLALDHMSKLGHLAQLPQEMLLPQLLCRDGHLVPTALLLHVSISCIRPTLQNLKLQTLAHMSYKPPPVMRVPSRLCSLRLGRTTFTGKLGLLWLLSTWRAGAGTSRHCPPRNE